jgi:hypothetical protein
VNIVRVGLSAIAKGESLSRTFTKFAVDIAKLRDYCLSETHPRGKHKARVFRSSLGLTANDAEWLRQELLRAVEQKMDELRQGEIDEYGFRYFLDVTLKTDIAEATVRSTWIVLAGDDVLRLTSCYVL